MLSFVEKANTTQKNKYEKKVTMVEYAKTDFYGPFITMRIEEFDGGLKNVFPISRKDETPEVSATDFVLLSGATKELYNKIGEFFLHTNLIHVLINSSNTEEIIRESLMRIKLF